MVFSCSALQTCVCLRQECFRCGKGSNMAIRPYEREFPSFIEPEVWDTAVGFMQESGFLTDQETTELLDIDSNEKSDRMSASLVGPHDGWDDFDIPLVKKIFSVLGYSDQEAEDLINTRWGRIS